MLSNEKTRMSDIKFEISRLKSIGNPTLVALADVAESRMNVYQFLLESYYENSNPDNDTRISIASCITALDVILEMLEPM